MKPNRTEAVVLAIVGIGLVLGIILSRTSEEFFLKRYVVEDGPTEWTTVVGLFACAVVMLRRLFTCKDKPWVFFRLACLGAALVFLFGAGEEISWGQRIFGIETPETLKELNRQSELNLHNLQFGDFSVNKFFFSKVLAVFLVSFLIIMPILYRKKKGFAGFVDSLAVPVPRPIHIVAWLVLIACTEGGLVATKKSGEMTEFGGSLLFLLIILFPLNAHIYNQGKTPDA